MKSAIKENASPITETTPGITLGTRESTANNTETQPIIIRGILEPLCCNFETFRPLLFCSKKE